MRGIPPLFAAVLLLAGGCSPKHMKPVASAEVMVDKTPKLAAFVRKALKDETVDGQVVTDVSLTSADLFGEGHFHETWKLTADLGGGRNKDMVLKVFHAQDKADANAIHYGFAQQYGWPIPKEIARGASANPLSDRPYLIMEFVAGGTLRKAVQDAIGAGGVGVADKVAALYAGLGTALGELHRKSLRKREKFDVSGVKALEALIEAGGKGGWCEPEVQDRLRKLLPALDGPQVAFSHGDLYESQLLMKPDGGVKAFIDLDTAHFDDQARDVGSMLAHLLIINPRTRKAAWGVAEPTAAETAASAKGFLAAYRAAADITDAAWPDLRARSKAFMWLRVHEVIEALGGSPHGAPVVEALVANRGAIFASDPFKDAGITE